LGHILALTALYSPDLGKELADLLRYVLAILLAHVNYPRMMKNVWGKKKISVCCYHLSPQSLMTADPKELFAWLFLDE
jgi:hypothetical protein